MLNRLRIGDHAGVEHVWSVGVLHVILAFFEDALDGRARFSRCLLIA
jgi:hypothetical protein